MASTQLQILERARLLASNLATGTTPVKKNTFFSVVADFMSDPQPDLNRLRRLLALLGEGKGGHLKRGDGYGDQVRTAVKELGRFLKQHDDLAPEDWKSIFGWTARLLAARATPEQEPRQDQPASARHEPKRDFRRGPDRPKPSSPSDRSRQPQPRKFQAEKFGGLDGKNQDTLKGIMERMTGKAEEKK